MNIQTVAENLRNTIAGKEMLLETYKNPSVLTKQIRETMTHMLEININELKRILEDVEQCEPSLPGEGNHYEKWDGDE
jgi:lantibiotic modifying enzyme